MKGKIISDWNDWDRKDLLGFVHSLVHEPYVDIGVCGSYAYQKENLIADESDLDVCVWLDILKPTEKHYFIKKHLYSYRGLKIDLVQAYKDQYLKGYPICSGGAARWYELPVYSLVTNQYLLEGKDYLDLRKLWGKIS